MELPWELRDTQVLGHRMAWGEVGTGDPILFLHGNPTSSILWRDVVPHVAHLGRCVLPDLIGMGRSAKLPGSGDERYRFVEHRRFLDALLDEIGVSDAVTLVLHDWGSGLGFDWACRHPDAVEGIAYMEAIVRPVTWEDWPDDARPIFEAMRSEAGESIVLDKNVFVERILPSAILGDIDEDVHAAYRAPFAVPGEDRRPTLTWPRQIPIEGEPADVHRIVSDYAEWLSWCDVPKLFLDADPGSILTGRQREFCLRWPNQTVVPIRGSHFVQEDDPHTIGAALAAWLARDRG